MGTQTKTTFKGLVDFTGTTHAGVKLNNLTTTQRDALTPASGMVIYNSTTNTAQKYQNGSWSDFAPVSSVNSQTGVVSLTTANITENTNLYYTDTRVRLNRLDQLASPTASVSLNSQKIIALADPTDAQDAATKSYVDSVAAGLDAKDSCRVATTANITLSGTQTIDGVAVIAGDRVLVKNQTAAENNGIYVVASGAWTRATDADISAEITNGMFTFITEGTVNASTGWVLTTTGTITLGTTPLTFAQFSAATTLTAGNGLSQAGTAFDVNVDNSSLEINADTLRVKASGVTNAMLAGSIDLTTKVTGALPIVNGGTGATSTSTARTALGAANIAGDVFTGLVRRQAIADTDVAFDAYVSGDSVNRFSARTDGLLEWGTGSATKDTNLYRDAANRLKTDDDMIVAGTFTAGTYTGQSTITTLGTIATGTWNGTPVALPYGGTGATDAATARSNLGLGTIATQAASSVAITGGSVTGITDLAIADGGTGASTTAIAFNNLSPLTTQGDLIYHNGTNNTRLAKGTANQFLQMNSGATAPSWTSPFARSRVTADATTTLATAGNVSGLSFAIAASETWSFEINLQTGCSSTGGVKFAITVPTGATFRAPVVGMSTAVSALTSAILTASGTLTGVAFNAVALSTGWVRITGCVVNSTTAGNIQLQFASTTAGQTSTIFANSYITAQKIG